MVYHVLNKSGLCGVIVRTVCKSFHVHTYSTDGEKRMFFSTDGVSMHLENVISIGVFSGIDSDALAGYTAIISGGIISLPITNDDKS